jgi:hypothetical protein
MFGSEDQNSNSQATPVTNMPKPDFAAPADTVMPTPVTPVDVPAANAVAEPDAAASAPSAPTMPDPMVTPSVQPLASVNAAPAQTGLAKPYSPDNAATDSSAMAAMLGSSEIDPDLAQIKQQALQSLEPLVSQLDQTPDEKFKTIMMLIQASDNSKMLQQAYAAASQITDEKTRAQALLDIVNEINYFTAKAQNKQ